MVPWTVVGLVAKNQWINGQTLQIFVVFGDPFQKTSEGINTQYKKDAQHKSHMHINGCLSQHYTHNISELYMAGNVLGSSEMFFLVLQFLPPPLNDFAAFMMIEAVALTPQPVAQTVS